MDLEKIIQTDQTYYMNTFGARTPVCFDHGEGVYLYATDGKRYMDLMGGIAVNALGHCHPAFIAALHAQIDKLIHTSSLYYVENQALLAKRLVECSCADKVFFANSGAEANEGAIKLARIYHYKKERPHKIEIITLKKSFHGRTLATVAATGQEKYQKPYKPLTPAFIHIDANDVDALKIGVNKNTCAIMLEVIQGESGVHPLTEEFVQTARKLCDENGLPLIFDEVQTGIGRTGKLFGYELYGIEPDIFTLAKALGGGVPIGAVCAKKKFCAFEPGDHGTTFGGNPLATRAGLAVLDILEQEHLVENSANMGLYMRQQLQGLPHVTEVRGSGLMLGVELHIHAKPVQNKLFENGFLCGVVGEHTLRLLPPLIINQEQIDQFVQCLKTILEGAAL